MNKIITASCVAVAAFTSIAMPNRQELAKAKPLVEAKTQSDLAAYKAGEMTAQKVALEHLVLAQKTEGEAEKYLLLQGAFKLYARSGEYNLAADAIQIMKREIKDLPPEVIAEIVGDELRYVSDDKAPRLVAMLKEAKAKIATEKAVVSPTGTARSRLGGSNLARREAVKEAAHLQATVGGYTWSYRVDNGEATIEAKKDGEFACAVLPNPTGDVSVPATLNGAKVTRIGREAFCHYCGPKSVTIPEGVTSIEWCAFYMCTNLTSVTLPKGLNSIGHGAFVGCDRLNSVVIPESVTNIAAEAFRFCGGLKSVNIPSGVKRINEFAFDLCYGLTNIVIPENVESIDRQAFYNCGGLKSVSIPANVKSLGMAAFAQCGDLASVTMLGEKPNASDDIFNDCPKLKEIHVPANAKSWAGMKEWQGKPLVFDGMVVKEAAHLQATVDGLTWSYRVDNGEAMIEAKKDGEFACAVSPNPTGDVSVPATLNGAKVTRIGREAFCHYCGPKSVTIPEGVTSIEWCAFYRDSNLKSVKLPSSLRDVGHGAFAECGALTNATIPAGVTNIAFDAFLCCGSLASVTLPANLKNIGPRAFAGCGRLNSVTIPSSVRVIGPAAFNRCRGLRSLTIGSGVKEIGEAAFEFCGGLTEVTMLGERPNALKDIFKGCDKLTAIHVPANAKSWAGMKEWQGKPLVFDAKVEPAK